MYADPFGKHLQFKTNLQMKMTKTNCPFCRAPMKFGLDDTGKSVVQHDRPWCVELQTNDPKEYLVLAAKKILDDTSSLIGSRGGN
jgi:hypothetical protein